VREGLHIPSRVLTTYDAEDYISSFPIRDLPGRRIPVYCEKNPVIITSWFYEV